MTSKRLWMVIAIMMLHVSASAVFAASTQATYYVSPTGSDANPGTLDQPFRSITKARDVVRTVNSSMTGDIVVSLRGGSYPLSSTVTFNPVDGGSNGFYVRYENYQGETPLLTGGIPITGWSVCDQANNIWCASGITERFRQLYVDGNKAIRARVPNLGTGGAANFWRLTKVEANGRPLNVDTSYISNWGHLDKAEMHLMVAWADATDNSCACAIAATMLLPNVKQGTRTCGIYA